MPKKSKLDGEPTTLEKYAIFSYCIQKRLNLNPTTNNTYLLCNRFEGSDASLNNTAQRWIKCEKIQKLIQVADEQIQAFINSLSVENEEKPKKVENWEKVDFADKDAFIAYVTRKANNIIDEKQRLDYLKILADIQRFKESKTDEQGEIQRFYTPQKCSSCPLYNDKSK